jgi:hypothetical protein
MDGLIWMSTEMMYARNMDFVAMSQSCLPFSKAVEPLTDALGKKMVEGNESEQKANLYALQSALSSLVKL